MFCLYHFSVKCIIKKNYLPPYGPLNVGKSKVMRCLRYGYGERMHVILSGEPLEEVDCFKYLGSQVAAVGGCERDVVLRMNEG